MLDIHSRLEVIRWLSDPPFVPMADLDEARAWIDNWGTGDIGPINRGLAIEVRDTGVVAGTVMITKLPNAEHGYATEAAIPLIAEAFAAGLDEIWCGMYSDNHASAAVAQRLRLIDRGIVPDPWYEGYSHLFSATAEEWANR